jgi:hypothetical protein
MQDRLGNASSDPDALFELCLPTHQIPAPSGALKDADERAFVVSALNPNLRIAGSTVQPMDVSSGPEIPPVRMQAITFFVHIGPSYVQVVEYKGRYFVRDGYHRVANLLHAGVTVIPCILITAQTFGEVCPPGSFVSYEVLYGDRPPMVSDFWDANAARDVEQVAVRKVIRVRADEFVVPR